MLVLTARAASALVAARGVYPPRSQRARHACLADPLVAAADAVELAVEAGQRLEDAHAYDEAVAHYRRALDVSRMITPAATGTTLRLEVQGRAGRRRGDRKST